MPGLGATLNCPTIGTVSAALAARGPGAVTCRLEGVGGIPLELAVRAVMPAIPRVVGDRPGEPIGAFAVDGVASVSQLDARYTVEGAAGLVVDGEPYAVIFADCERAELVLARGGEGPGLYYARLGDGWVAASEPAALLVAGVAAAPDPTTVERFVATGACDDTADTLLLGIRRVLAAQAVVLCASGAVRAYRVVPGAATAVGPVQAMQAAVNADRVGVRLTPGPAGAALLGTALTVTPRSRPLPVHCAVYPGLGGAMARTPAALVPLPYGVVQPSVHAFAPEQFDLETFLCDLGEPVPDPHAYVLWSIARAAAGEVDVLVDSAVGGGTGANGCAWLARLSDRVRARYGVSIRRPLCGEANDANGEPDEKLYEELVAVAAGTLPTASARHATADSAATPAAADLVLALRAKLAAIFMSERFAARPWNDRFSTLAALRDLCAGRPANAGALFRRYLVERWLSALTPLSGVEAAGPPGEITAGSASWARMPLSTERFGPGDPLAAKAAWHVNAALSDLMRERTHAAALRSPWLVLIAGKAVAVSQRRVTPLWEVAPGRAARVLAAVARTRLPRLGDPWTMQVALAEGGLARVGAGVFAARLGWRRWAAQRLPPEAANVFAPRPDAVAPADSAVVRAPWKPDEFAAAAVAALRLAVPAEVFFTLAGCAVVSADAASARVLGFAPGPHRDALTDPADLIAALCADNPAGQAGEQTPVVLMLRVARRGAADRDVKERDAAIRPPTRAGQSPSR